MHHGKRPGQMSGPFDSIEGSRRSKSPSSRVLHAGMPQPVVTKIGSARRVKRPITLRAIGSIARRLDGLIERHEGKTGVERGPVIVGVAVAIAALIVGVIVA